MKKIFEAEITRRGWSCFDVRTYSRFQTSNGLEWHCQGFLSGILRHTRFGCRPSAQCHPGFLEKNAVYEMTGLNVSASLSLAPTYKSVGLPSSPFLQSKARETNWQSLSLHQGGCSSGVGRMPLRVASTKLTTSLTTSCSANQLPSLRIDPGPVMNIRVLTLRLGLRPEVRWCAPSARTELDGLVANENGTSIV
jgi:hypothetical protein